ncbi:hypothetical protein [Kitasatospora sp. NPDC051914]|uniref:hypothetical protein n=1 Tax=Kitasatospora sp. NPDC051914 TaxID=3154945 RepID=UPI0034125126
MNPRGQDERLREEIVAATVRMLDALGDGRRPALHGCRTGPAAEVALDLRAAVHGAVSLRVNEPDRAWPRWRSRSTASSTGRSGCHKPRPAREAVRRPCPTGRLSVPRRSLRA